MPSTIVDLRQRRRELLGRVDALERDLGDAARTAEGLRCAVEQAERALARTTADLRDRRGRADERAAKASELAEEFGALKAEVIELRHAREVVEEELERVKAALPREIERHHDLRGECRRSAAVLVELRRSLRRVEEEVNVLLVKREGPDGIH